MKICDVKLNNEYVTVIDYDGVDVQIPAIKREARTVKVIFKNGKYIVVGDDYVEPAAQTPKKPQPTNKKTTNKKGVKEKIDNNTVVNKK